LKGVTERKKRNWLTEKGAPAKVNQNGGGSLHSQGQRTKKEALPRPIRSPDEEPKKGNLISNRPLRSGALEESM